MTRTNLLRPATAAFLFALVPVSVACNGRVSLGNTGDTLQAVSGGTASVAQAPSSCPAGWAHPNICCNATAGKDPSCGAWEENPFRACESGMATYPDPLSCCSLSDPKTCSDNPPSSGPVPPPPPVWGCGYVCPPGWYSSGPGACCEVTSTGPGVCNATAGVNGSGASSTPSCGIAYPGNPGSGSGSGGGGGPVEVDAGVAGDASLATDGGVPDPIDASAPPPIEDASVGCPPVDAGTGYPGYDGGPASLCGACPPGWTPDSVQPEVCCEELSDGTRLCFSQAVGSVTPGIGGSGSGGSTGNNGGGVSTPPSGPSWGGGEGSADGATGPTCSGSSSMCSCENTANGHTYALDCVAQSDGTVVCSCSEDSGSTGLKPGLVTSCLDANQVTNAYGAAGCGFP
jgi:hypothetical protein